MNQGVRDMQHACLKEYGYKTVWLGWLIKKTHGQPVDKFWDDSKSNLRDTGFGEFNCIKLAQSKFQCWNLRR